LESFALRRVGGGLGFIFAVLINEVVMRVNEAHSLLDGKSGALRVYCPYLSGRVIAVRRQDEVKRWTGEMSDSGLQRP